jgi:hypothetical protein
MTVGRDSVETKFDPREIESRLDRDFGDLSRTVSPYREGLLASPAQRDSVEP